MTKRDDELQKYKDAVWDYILEHCDITQNGSYFVKFHTTGRFTFEKRIRARMKGYHRHDERMNFTRKQKEKDATARRSAHLSRKAAKRRKWKNQTLPLAEQKKAMEQLKADREKKEKTTHVDNIHRQQIQPLARKWYDIRNLLCLKNRQQKKQ